MATETADPGPASSDEETPEAEGRFTPHLRSMTVTAGATLLGIVAGILSTLFATTASTPPEPNNTLGFGILLGTVIVQFPIYQALGLDVTEFETKDQIYIFAMTFMLWFVTWTVLLTTGALI